MFVPVAPHQFNMIYCTTLWAFGRMLHYKWVQKEQNPPNSKYDMVSILSPGRGVHLICHNKAMGQKKKEKKKEKIGKHIHL